MQLFYSYDNDGYSETDRTGAAQDYHLTILRNCPRPPPIPMVVRIYPPDCDYMCLYTSALLSAELGS